MDDRDLLHQKLNHYRQLRRAVMDPALLDALEELIGLIEDKLADGDPSSP